MPYAGTTQDQDGSRPGPQATPLSLSDLYDALAAQVYGIAAHVVGDADLAEDITEGVLLDLFRDALDGEGLSELRQRATLLTHRAAVRSLRYGTPAAWEAPTGDAGRDPAPTDVGPGTVATEADPSAAGVDRGSEPTTNAAAQVGAAPGASTTAGVAATQPDLAAGPAAVALLERLPEAEQLSDVQRQRVALAFYGGRTYDEIARLSGADPRDVSEDLCSSLRRLCP